MKLFVRVCLIGIAALLASCAGMGQPLTPSPSLQLGIAKGDYLFDKADNFLVKQYIALSPSLSASDQATALGGLKHLEVCDHAGKCTGAVPVADEAATVGNQATLTQQLAIIADLVGKVSAALHIAAPPVS